MTNEELEELQTQHGELTERLRKAEDVYMVERGWTHRVDGNGFYWAKNVGNVLYCFEKGRAVRFQMAKDMEQF